MIDVLVISLPDSVERRARSAEELGHFGIPFEFVDALRGNSEHALVQKINQRKFILRNRRKALDGEIGCYASHYSTWLRCIEINRPVVIFEDDFQLLPRAGDFFNVAEKIAIKAPLVKLEVPSKIKRNRRPVEIMGFNVFEYVKVPHCCIAYMLTPWAAKVLVRNSYEFKYPVDVFIRNIGLHGMPVWGLRPAVADRGPHNFRSEIGDRVDYVGPWGHLPRLGFRFANALKNRWVGKYI
jgi:glycosyl transferase family 25